MKRQTSRSLQRQMIELKESQVSLYRWTDLLAEGSIHGVLDSVYLLLHAAHLLLPLLNGCSQLRNARPSLICLLCQAGNLHIQHHQVFSCSACSAAAQHYCTVSKFAQHHCRAQVIHHDPVGMRKVSACSHGSRNHDLSCTKPSLQLLVSDDPSMGPSPDMEHECLVQHHISSNFCREIFCQHNHSLVCRMP